MSDEIQFRCARSLGTLVLAAAAVIVLPFAAVTFSAAQIHGIPPSVTSIQNHFPPYLPNARASVTSLGPLGWVGPPAFPVYTWPYSGTTSCRRCWGSGSKTGFGGGFIAPFYVPIADPSNTDDPGGAGPYLYSGPPPDQAPHIVVDTPPARHDTFEDEDDVPAPAVVGKSKHESDLQPIDPTVLVFRDGHHQEVTNYAVMGQTIYVFDAHRQKIALGDLDLPATIKVNDDRGVEFQLPKPKQS